jgi:hypothetical protein
MPYMFVIRRLYFAVFSLLRLDDEEGRMQRQPNPFLSSKARSRAVFLSPATKDSAGLTDL